MSLHSRSTPTSLYIDLSVELDHFVRDLVNTTTTITKLAAQFDQLNERITLDQPVIAKVDHRLIIPEIIFAKMNFAAGVLAVHQSQFERAALCFESMYAHIDMCQLEVAFRQWINEEICEGSSATLLAGDIEKFMREARTRHIISPPLMASSIKEIVSELGQDVPEKDLQPGADIAPVDRRDISTEEDFARVGNNLEKLIELFAASKDHDGATNTLKVVGDDLNQLWANDRGEVPESALGLLSAKIHNIRYAVEADKNTPDPLKLDYFKEQTIRISQETGCNDELKMWQEDIRKRYPKLKLD